MEVPQSGYLLLDGATATNLYREGMPQGICIEEYILNHPDTIKKLHSDFINAGSDIIYAPTFSANREKLRFFGLADKVVEINKQIIDLTRQSAGSCKVAGNMSPTGLFIEPYGDMTFNELIEIYSQQAEALDNAGVDLFVIETMFSLYEARAAILACRKYGKPIYVTFTINEKGRTLSGATPLTCLISLQGLGISAFGLNCSFGPDMLVEYIEEISPFASIPIIAKPNAGQPNPIIPHMYDLSPKMMREQMSLLLDAGASIIGGCCGTTPEHIKEMRELLDSYVPTHNISHPQQTNDILLTNETQIFGLDNDRIEFTEPIMCELDMADHFVNAEEDSFDVLLIHLDTIDDAMQFSLNAHLAKLPVCFYSTNEHALETAIKLYHGVCMVDSQSPIELSILKEISDKFGAVLY